MVFTHDGQPIMCGERLLTSNTRSLTMTLAELVQDLEDAQAEFCWVLQHDGSDQELIAAQEWMIAARCAYEAAAKGGAR